jgi:peroxiredoxin
MDAIALTVVTDGDSVVPAWRDGDRLLVRAADLPAATGWERKPEGLCRGDECVPVRDGPVDVDVDVEGDEPMVDLAAVAAQIRRPFAAEPSAGVAVLGRAPLDVESELAGGEAPDFTLPTLDGEPVALHDSAGTKRLLVTFASWCGCRYDLPAWAARQQEWADQGFSVLAVALDEDAEAVRPYAEAAPGLTVLIDREHEVAERYGMVNVPTVVWIDEDGKVARSNDAQFGDDQFVEFHGQESGPHLDALRRWVEDGEAPGEGAVRTGELTPSPEVALARVERRLAAHLLRSGHPEAADRHFDRAIALAPLDFPVRRGSMPLRGQDPFGDAFFELYAEWEQVGRPYYRRPT